MKCQRYEYIDKQLFKQIQASRICPMCYQEIVPTTILDDAFVYYIMDEKYDGYRVFVDFKFGCKPKATITHVCRYIGGNIVEARFIICNMGYSFYFDPKRSEWKKRNAQGYMYRFCSLKQGKQYSGKKEFIYTALFDRGYRSDEIDELIKSNQKKILQDNLMNGEQMEYVIAFDLKSYDQVYKYRTYIRKNEADIYKKLNIYYLDYLYRNKIRIRDFYDYMRDCEELGFKLDKPVDFQHRHLVVSDMVIQKRRESDEVAIKKRYVQLNRKSYVKGNVEILPFKDSDEIIKCGKKLHNCIGTYLHRYATKATDLYYLKRSGRMVVAIEVSKKKLIQARADNNKDCPPEMMKHIRKWCEMNNFVRGDN